MTEGNYKEVLKDALESKNELSLNKKAIQDLDIILTNAESSKAVLAVLITSLVKKIGTPTQDIRLHQAGLKNGYSGRGLDTKVVTPFLTENNFPSMGSGSGWLTRSLEQSSPYTLDYKGAVKPQIVKDAFLRIIDRVENKKLNPKIALEYLFSGLVQKRDSSLSLKIAKPTNLSIETIVHYLNREL